jgi:Trp operon repressor
LHWLKAIKLIEKAKEEDKKDKLYQVWLTKVPSMNKKNYISFTEFWKKANMTIDRTPTKDIMAEATRIRRKAGRIKEADNADI